MRLLFRTALLATIAIPTLLAPAHAQVDSREGIALQNEIYQLRQELRQLQDQRGYGGQQYGGQQRISGSSSDLLTQLLSRVETLEDQVRQLRGRVDETQNQVQQQNLELNKKLDDLKFQMSTGTAGTPGQPGAAMAPAGQPGTGEASTAPLPTGQLTPPAYGPAGSGGTAPGYGAAPAAGQSSGAVNQLTPAPPVPPQPPARPAGPRTPEMAMQDGRAALARRDYAAAEAAAREVLAHRTSPRAYDAKLLLAQALEGQRQYPQAAIAFDDAYNMSRKGSHAQEALVGLASSLTAIRENKAACDTLARLRSDFPQVRADLRSSVAAVTQKAGCR